MKTATRISIFMALLCAVFAPAETLAKEKAKDQELPILVYHQISRTVTQATDAPTIISLERFEEQMRYLHENGYRTLSMDEVMHFLHGHKFHGKIVAIQFDDGWESAMDAVPTLKQYGFKATFFIVAGFPDGPNKRYMGWEKIKQLSKNPLFGIESHTMTHPWQPGNTLTDWLAGKTPGKGEQQAEWELTESKRLLEYKLGKPVKYLAWPSGIYNPQLVKMAHDAGYTALLTVDGGMNHAHEDPLHVARAPMDGRCNFETFKHIVTAGYPHECESDPAPAKANITIPAQSAEPGKK